MLLFFFKGCHHKKILSQNKLVSHEGKVLYIVAVIALGLTRILIVLTDRKFSAADSYSLGIFLGIGQDTMKTFQADSRNVKNLLTKVVSFWLKNYSEKSWKKLADALEGSSYKLLADKI